jgi:beta-xylosidase
MPDSFGPAGSGFDGSHGAAVPAASPPAARTYVNPILDADFPDPAVIEAPDGYYYAYYTQTLRVG